MYRKTLLLSRSGWTDIGDVGEGKGLWIYILRTIEGGLVKAPSQEHNLLGAVKCDSVLSPNPSIFTSISTISHPNFLSSIQDEELFLGSSLGLCNSRRLCQQAARCQLRSWPRSTMTKYG